MPRPTPRGSQSSPQAKPVQQLGTPSMSVQKPNEHLKHHDGKSIAIFNAKLAELNALEDKAEKLSRDFVIEYNELVDKRISELAKDIAAEVYPSSKPKFIKMSSTKSGVNKKKPYIAKNNFIPFYSVDYIDTPYGELPMTESMKKILKMIEPVEVSIDEDLISAGNMLKEVPYLNRARLVGLEMSVSLRRSFRDLHTDVFGLIGEPECAGDIIIDGYVSRYMNNFLSGNYPKALEYLYGIANQFTCISAFQGRSFDNFLRESHDEAVSKYAEQVGESEEDILEMKKYLNAALYNLALLSFDFNAAMFSRWQSWFCKNSGLNVALYVPGKPLYNFGIWLYDRPYGTLTGESFTVDLEETFECHSQEEALLIEGYTYYGNSLNEIAALCDSMPDPEFPVTFASFNRGVAETNLGLDGFLNTAAEGMPDLSGICGGGAGGGGSGGGGSVTCSMAGGGGSGHKCAAAPFSWPAGQSGAEGFGLDPLPVDIVKLRTAALCGDAVGGDSPDDGGFGWQKKVTEKKYGPVETQGDKIKKEKLKKGAEAGMNSIKENKQKIFDAINKHTGIDMTNTDNQATFLAGAAAGLYGAKVGGKTTCGAGGCTATGTTNTGGSVEMPGIMLPGAKGFDSTDWGHEGIHAGLVALRVGINEKSSTEKVPGTNKAARKHHLITGDAGFGYSTHFPKPDSSDLDTCTMLAMGSFMSAANCKPMSDLEWQDFCSGGPAAMCMPPTTGFDSTGDGFVNEGVLNPVGTTPMPDDPANFSGVWAGPCSVGGGSPVNMLILIGGGVVDPMASLSNWINERFMDESLLDQTNMGSGDKP